MTLITLGIKLSACAAICATAAGIYDNAAQNIQSRDARIAEMEAGLSGFTIYAVDLKTNTAIIRNHDFLIKAEFDFDIVDDSNGVLGHSDQTIDITSFGVVSVVNTKTGKSHIDYTEVEDHQQIIAQIRAYVDQNRLAQGV